MPTSLLTPINDLAVALGLFDSGGSLRSEFFSDPLTNVESCLSRATQRKALLAALNDLLQADADSHADQRSYSLLNKDNYHVAFTLVMGDAASVEVTLGVSVQIVIDETSGIKLRAEIPLLHAASDALKAVTASAEGPILASFVFPLPDPGVLTAEAMISTGGSALGIRLEDLVVDGIQVPPLELRTDEPSAELSAFVLKLIGIAGQLLSGDATVGDAIGHLLGVFGLDPALAPVPVDIVISNPTALRQWIAQMAEGDAIPLRQWLAHFAGLANLTLVGPTTSKPESGTPWTITLFNGSPKAALTIALADDGKGGERLLIGARLSMDAPAGIEASIGLALDLLDLPLGPSGEVQWFTGIQAGITSPRLSTTTDLAPKTNDFGLGRIWGGLAADRNGLRPSLVLENVWFNNIHHDTIDLSSAEALTSAASQAVGDALSSALGSTGRAHSLLILLGLSSPAGNPTLDLGLFASDPLRALGAHQRDLLTGAGWGESLQALAGLFGLDAPTIDATVPDTWRARILDTGGVACDLVVAGFATDTGHTLSIGAEVNVPATAGGVTAQLKAALDLLELQIAADGSLSATGFQSVRCEAVATNLATDEFACSSLSLALGWSPGMPGTVSVQIADVCLGAPPDDDVRDERAQLGTIGASLNLETGQWDLDTTESLEEMLGQSARWAIVQLARAGDPIWKTVLSSLVEPLVESLVTPAGRADFLRHWPQRLAQLLGDLFERGGGLDLLRSLLAEAGDAAVGGLGTRSAPWLWQMDASAPGRGLALWLAQGQGPAPEPRDPEKPEANPVLESLTRAMGCCPELRASLEAQDPAQLANGLLALDDWALATGGLWRQGIGRPDSAWGDSAAATTLTDDSDEPGTAVTAVSPLEDPAAVDAVVVFLDPLLQAGAVPVLVIPSWWPPRALVALTSRLDPNKNWQWINLGFDALEALASIDSADGYVISAAGDPSAEQDADLASALSRIVSFGSQVALVAAGTALRAVANWVSAQNGGSVAGLVALAAPFSVADEGASALDLTDANVAEAVRFADLVLRSEAARADDQLWPWRELVKAWREVADEQSVPSDLRRAGAGVLTAAALDDRAALTLPVGLPLLAITVDATPGFADGIGRALDLFQASSSESTSAVAALVAPPTLPAAAGPVRAAVSQAIELANMGWQQADAGPTTIPDALRWRARLDLDGTNGWLVGPPSSQAPLAVRRLTVELSADIDASGRASADVMLVDVCSAGIAQPLIRSGDPLFQPAYDLAIGTLLGRANSGDAHARAVAELLAVLGLVTGSGSNFAVANTALASLLDTPADWLAARAKAALNTGSLLGLEIAPASIGTQRWTSTVASGLQVEVIETNGAWTVTVSAPEPGLTFAQVGQFAFNVSGGNQSPVARRWRLGILGAELKGAPDGVTVGVAGDVPVRVWPLDDPAGQEAALAKIGPKIPVAIGCGFASVLIEAWTGFVPPISGLLGWIEDPWGTLGKRLSALETLGQVPAVLANGLGLSLTADGALPLIPSAFELRVESATDGARLVLSTPTAGWSPANDLTLHLSAGVRFSASPPVAPSGSFDLEVGLAAASANAWKSVSLHLGYDGSGFQVSATPVPGSPLQLYPQFSGLSQLVADSAQRLLPSLLDAVLAASPPGPWGNQVIAFAKAAGLYGTTFSDAPVKFADLSVDTLTQRASAIATAAVQLLASATGTNLGGTGPVRVAPVNNGVSLSFNGPGTSTCTATMVFSPPSLSLGIAKLSLGLVSTDISGQAQLSGGNLSWSGTVQLGVDLTDLLRISPGPRLAVDLSPTNGLRAALWPLGTEASKADAEIVLLPAPSASISNDGWRQLAMMWLVAPGLELVVRICNDKLDTALLPGDDPPTLRSLLVSSGLLSNGHVTVPLPDPMTMLVGAAGALSAKVALPLASGLSLGLLANTKEVGLALKGDLPIAMGDFTTTIKFAEPGTDGLGLAVLQSDQGEWRVLPALVLNQIGFNLTREGGLIGSGPVMLGDVGLGMGLKVNFDPTNRTVKVSDLAALLRLGKISIPALTGDGDSGNGVAGNLLGSASRNGAPINPALTLVLGWDGQNFTIQFGDKPMAEGEKFWIDIGKSFGPLHIERIGLESGKMDVSYDGATVSSSYVGVAVDGGIEAGPLTMAVMGLGLRVPLRCPNHPECYAIELDGLTVSFDSGGISIAGGLLKALVVDGQGNTVLVNGKVTYEYRGMLEVVAFGYGATALGAYTQMAKADGTKFTSLFLFAAVHGPIGGPPYLFITGIAGGFGYNRDFLPPSQPDRVGSFPLVAAMGDSTSEPQAILQSMGPSLPPREGAYWFAAGITFTTFELIATRALVYLKIMPEGFEVGLLGLMSAALPNEDSAIVRLELGLHAYYSSVEQVFSVQAQLTANSWLFSKDCRLTGGFAFVIWFARPQAVLTVGGYGPNFTPPDYYPLVPPVGFQWRFSSEIVVKGESYFALTPEAIMAGGRLEVSASCDWGSGSLLAYCDAILWFHPPHFVLNTGFRITGSAFGFSFDLSADLHLELPPIYAKVHVNFMWGFEFEIGHLPSPPPFLTLDEFFTRHVDSSGKFYVFRALAGDAPSADAATPDGSAALPYRVLPEFTIEVTSKLPCYVVSGPGNFYAASGNGELYAVPLGPAPALDPQLIIQIARQNSDGLFEILPNAQIGGLTINLVETGVPAAVWIGQSPVTSTPFGVFFAATPATPTGQNMRKVPAGVSIQAASSVTTTAGLPALNVGNLVDEHTPRALPLEKTGAPTVSQIQVRLAKAKAKAAAPTVLPKPAKVPRLLPQLSRSVGAAKSPGAGFRTTARTASAPVSRGVFQLWELAHGQAPGKIRSEVPARIMALNPMGDILADHPQATAPVDLPQRTVAVVVLAGDLDNPRAHRLGWDWSTPAHMLTPTTFAVAGATLQFPVMLQLPRRANPDMAIPARYLIGQCPTVCTRLASGPGAGILVALDAVNSGATLADVAVAVAGGRVGAPQIIGDAAHGRMHLFYPVLERSAPTLDVSVHAGPESWKLAGVLSTEESPDSLRARFGANPWADLWSEQSQPSARVRLNRNDRPVTFKKSGRVTLTLPATTKQ